MKSKPKERAEQIATAIHVWETLRPNATYAGMTLADFKAALKPSLDTREAIDELETQLIAKQDQRDAADEASILAIKRFVSGIKADPTEGEDSELLEALGYVRPSERKSGLTRGKKETDKPTP